MAASNEDGRRPIRAHYADGATESYEAALARAARRGAAPTRPPVIAVAAGASVAFLVLAAAAIALISMGLRNVIPLWQTPMLQDLGWTSLEFSIALASQNLVWGLCAPVFGGFADRFGSSRILALGGMMYVGGIWLMSTATDPAAFFVSAGLLIGMAQAAAGMGIALGAVGRAVPERQRTIAFGLITSASSAGMIVLTPIAAVLLRTFHWSDAFVWLALMATPIILLALLVRNRQDAGDPSTAAVARLTIGQALREAVRHRGFVLLVFGFFVCGFHVSFIGVHFPKYLNDIGLGEDLAAAALMIIGVFNVASCLAVGVVATAFSKRGVLAVIYLGRAVIILAFVMTPPSAWSVYLFSAGMGVLWLSTVPPTQGIVAQVFGTQYMTMLFGVVFLSHQVGSFLGVYLGAEAVDRLGSYDLVWYAAAALGIFAAICHILIDERPLARLSPKLAAQPAE